MALETGTTVDSLVSTNPVATDPVGQADDHLRLIKTVLKTTFAGITGVADEDDMSSDSAAKLATQQSIKAYVDSQVTAQDLDLTSDSGSIAIDLDSESLTVAGGTGIDSSATSNTVTLAIDSTVATLTGSQTLTNKVLTSPTLNTPTIGTSFTIGSATITEAELEVLDGATLTTTELNYVDGVTSAIQTQLDAKAPLATPTFTTSITIGSATISEAELEILDGATVTTAELNVLDGITATVSELNILDGVTSTASELNILDGVTSTATELNILDGVTATTAELNYSDTGSAVGTVVASKVVTVDANKDVASFRNITLTGELDAGSLDVSGDADIDGTLEADAITVDGTALNEYIADTVGAMVGSNTETNITVTYEDADNTLDFVIGTLNQDTTGTAALATSFTVTANNSADETVYPIFVDGVDGTQGAETDSGLTYNPSTGLLTSTGFSGNLTGTLQTAAQANVTSVGTLTSLTISGDLTVDTNTLKVDSSNNRVGINQASPDVTLDLGANTDAVHMPVGTTAQRPGSPAAGYFRYNSETAKFEGYTDEWGSIAGGGSGTNMDTNIFAGNGSDYQFTLSTAPDTEQNLMVFIDGVFQAHSSYSVSGTTLDFGSSFPPANGRVITAYHSTTTVGGSNATINTMTGDNSDVTLTLSVAPVHENNTQVYFDGVYQSKSNYSISGTTLTFSTAPPTGVLVEAITLTNTSITTAAQLVDADADTLIQVEESSDEDKIRFDIAGSEKMVLDSTGLGIGTASPSTSLDIVRAGVQPLRLESSSGTEVAINMVNTGGNVQLEAHSGNFVIDADKVSINAAGASSPAPLQHFQVIHHSGGGRRSTLYYNQDNKIALGALNASSTWEALAIEGASIDLKTGGTTNTSALNIDASGNLGIGNPSLGTGTGQMSIRIGGSGLINAHSGSASSGQVMGFSQNAQYDTDDSWEAISTDAATNYYQGSGAHYFRVAGSTSAGADITWTSPMTIDNVGQTTVTTAAQTSYPFRANNTHASFNGWGYGTDISRAASSDFYFLVARSNLSVSADNEFLLRGNGDAYADGVWNAGGADYAEYFEWKDGNSDGEDRRGYPVVLDGNMIRKATSDDSASSIIGIVSTAPAIVGDSDTEQYKQKYLKDDFGSFIWEDYTVTEWDEITYGGPSESNAETISYQTDQIPSDVTPPSEDVKNEKGQVVKAKAVVTSTDADGNNLRRKKLNPDYDSSKTYETRESRKEWEAIGLMGKLRMRKGQPTGDRWIKMRDITDSIEEWLVR